MNVEILVSMANDIGNYFSSDPDRATGVAGMVDHIERFWEPRMRKEILAYAEGGGAGMMDLVREAVLKLR